MVNLIIIRRTLSFPYSYSCMQNQYKSTGANLTEMEHMRVHQSCYLLRREKHYFWVILKERNELEKSLQNDYLLKIKTKMKKGKCIFSYCFILWVWKSAVYILRRMSIAWFWKASEFRLKLKGVSYELSLKELERVLIIFQDEKHTDFLTSNKIFNPFNRCVLKNVLLCKHVYWLEYFFTLLFFLLVYITWN